MIQAVPSPARWAPSMSQGWTATSIRSISSTPHCCAAKAYAPGAGFHIPGIFDREQPFEVLADSCPFEQTLGDSGRSIAEGQEAGGQSSEGGYAVEKVGVHGQLIEAAHDVFDRLVDAAVEGQAAETCTKHAGAELGEWRGAAGGGEREAVAKERCEPCNGQVGGAPTLTNRLAIGDMSERVSLTSKRRTAGTRGPSMLTGRSELGRMVSMLLLGRFRWWHPGGGCRRSGSVCRCTLRLAECSCAYLDVSSSQALGRFNGCTYCMGRTAPSPMATRCRPRSPTLSVPASR